MADEQNDWMRGLGAVANMRFGPGVLGRLGSVLAVSVVVLGAVACALAFKDPSATLQVVYLIGGLLVTYLIGGLAYAAVQPRAAALESSDWTQVLLRDAAMKAPPNSSMPTTTPSLVNITPIQNPKITEADPSSRKADV